MSATTADAFGAAINEKNATTSMKAAYRYITANAQALGEKARIPQVLAAVWRFLAPIWNFVKTWIPVIGSDAVTMFALTTNTGRSFLLDWLPRTIAKLLAKACKVVTYPLMWVLRHLGAPGRYVHTKILFVVALVTVFASSGLDTVKGFLDKHNNHPVMVTVRALCWVWVVTTALSFAIGLLGITSSTLAAALYLIALFIPFTKVTTEVRSGGQSTGVSIVWNQSVFSTMYYLFRGGRPMHRTTSDVTVEAVVVDEPAKPNGSTPTPGQSATPMNREQRRQAQRLAQGHVPHSHGPQHK